MPYSPASPPNPPSRAGDRMTETSTPLTAHELRLRELTSPQERAKINRALATLAASGSSPLEQRMVTGQTRTSLPSLSLSAADASAMGEILVRTLRGEILSRDLKRRGLLMMQWLAEAGYVTTD